MTARLGMAESAGLVGWRPTIYARGLDTAVFHYPVPLSTPLTFIHGRHREPQLHGLPADWQVTQAGTGWRINPCDGVSLEWGTQLSLSGGVEGKAGVRVTLGPAWLWRFGASAFERVDQLVTQLFGHEGRHHGAPVYRVDYAVDMSPPNGVHPVDLIGEVARRWRKQGDAAVSLWTDGEDGATVARGRRGKTVQVRVYHKTARAQWDGLWRYVPEWASEGWRWRCSSCRWTMVSELVAAGDRCPACGAGEVRPSLVIRCEVELPRRRLVAEGMGEAARWARVWCSDTRLLERVFAGLGCAAYDLRTAGARYAPYAMRGIPWWAWRAFYSGRPDGLPREHRAESSDAARAAYWEARAWSAARRAQRFACLAPHVGGALGYRPLIGVCEGEGGDGCQPRGGVAPPRGGGWADRGAESASVYDKDERGQMEMFDDDE